MFLRVVFVMLLLSAVPAFAGAFLQPEGKLLIIQQATSGRLQSDCLCIAAKKYAADTTLEWGLASFLTLLGQVSNGRRIISAEQDELYPAQLSELGARVALWQAGPRLVSAQVTLRAPDRAFELRPGLPLRELRLMLGQSFNTALGPGFLSLAPGLRAGAGRATEGHLEATGGLNLSERWQALGQVFSLWRGGVSRGRAASSTAPSSASSSIPAAIGPCRLGSSRLLWPPACRGKAGFCWPSGSGSRAFCPLERDGSLPTSPLARARPTR